MLDYGLDVTLTISSINKYTLHTGYQVSSVWFKEQAALVVHYAPNAYCGVLTMSLLYVNYIWDLSLHHRICKGVCTERAGIWDRSTLLTTMQIKQQLW